MSNEIIEYITVEEGLDLLDRKYDGIGASDVERRIWDGNTDGSPWDIIQQLVVADQPAYVVCAPETLGQYLSEAVQEYNQTREPDSPAMEEIYSTYTAGVKALTSAVWSRTAARPNNVGLGSIVLDYGLSKRGQFGWSGTSEEPTFHPVLSWAETSANGALNRATGAVGFVQLYVANDLMFKNGRYTTCMSPFPKTYVGGGDSGEVEEWCQLPTMHGIVKLYWEESDITADMQRVRRAVTALTAQARTARVEDDKPEDTNVVRILPAL